MQEINIEERLSQRKVIQTLESAIRELQMLKPNGAIVHKRNCIIMGLAGHKHVVERRYSEDILFKNYHLKFPISYGSIIRTLESVRTYIPI